MKKITHLKIEVAIKTILVASLVTTLSFVGHSQENKAVQSKKSEKRIMEFQEGDYVPSPRKDHATSPAYRYFSTNFFTVQVNVDDFGNNIVDDAANEPSIAFDVNDPNKMAIGWRQFDNISSSFRQAGYGYTDDGGQNWTFPGVIDPGVFRSDPVLGCDGEGNFYYNSLTVSGNSYWCNVYRSGDGGNTWEMGTYAYGGDKQWMSIDRRVDVVGAANVYEFWSTASSCEPHYFTRSTDANESYENCSDIPGLPYWGTTVVDPNGALYIAGAQWTGFEVAKSSNALQPDEDIIWDYYNSVYLDGDIIGFGGDICPNPGGLLGQTIFSKDTSGGPNDGNLYVLCSVERNSISDPCDVMFSRSTDDGVTWDLPIRINDDPGFNAYQWFGTMSVAPDGRIDVIWLDTRDNPGSVYSSLYYYLGQLITMTIWAGGKSYRP